ncbi:MAG: CoA protein activase [Clostridia bacterium]|nr:CoA protein activase [Clostridia bacterium]
MKVTFPHMGNLSLTAETLLRGIGLEVVVPPPCTKKTLSLGVQHSPEFACLPLKINLGNYLEAYEQGADTALMVGGIGPCRIGYYGAIQQEILRDLGIKMNLIVLEPPDAHPRELWDKIKHLKQVSWRQVVAAIKLTWHKTRSMDLLEEKALILRAKEAKKGSIDSLLSQARTRLQSTDSIPRIKEITRDYLALMDDVALSEEFRPVKIVLVGEIYTVLEPFVNLNLEKHLNSLGVEVLRPLFLSSWINEHLLGGLLNIEGTKRAPGLAKPYLNSFVGGHGRETIGSAVQYAQKGVDGVIQIAPLTCMPEIVAHSVLPSVTEEYGIPALTLYVDEQTGEAGLLTRLEAFVDMIRYRQRRSS